MRSANHVPKPLLPRRPHGQMDEAKGIREEALAGCKCCMYVCVCAAFLGVTSNLDQLTEQR